MTTDAGRPLIDLRAGLPTGPGPVRAARLGRRRGMAPRGPRPPGGLAARRIAATRLAWLPVLAALLAAGCASAPAGAPRSLILMIGDGMGPATITLARDARQGPLALDGILVGAVATRPLEPQWEGDNHPTTITDSAASATALATGRSTLNERIAVDRLGAHLPTLVEAARDAGRATGLITTTAITHATPAAFASHVKHRGMEQEIAAQLAAAGIDLLVGGGRENFLPTTAGGLREDGRDLLAERAAAGVTVAQDGAALHAATTLPLVAVLAPRHLAFACDVAPATPAEPPSLRELTARALDLLAADGRPFVLMIEGGRIDHAAHGNDPVAHLHDMLAFDAAVAEALAFVEARGDVLLVVTADHETGGLTLGADVAGKIAYEYRPELLLAASRSAESLAADMLAGSDGVALLRQHWQLSDLTDAERLAIDEQVATHQVQYAAAQDAGKSATELAELTREFRYRLTPILGHAMSRRARVGWTTGGHTGVDVGLWAAGPGAAQLAGHHHNAALGRRLSEVLGLEFPQSQD